ncbi:MAG TPA: hypothetical protein VL970_10520, partial [Candidatus Acidoferrales bacterium]|nr:hypothetical protein [Candidatus Acidoferrales bacterium]
KERRGLGLTHMRERALSLGGTFTLTSHPGKGTTILARVPLKKPETISTAQIEIPAADSSNFPPLNARVMSAA